MSDVPAADGGALLRLRQVVDALRRHCLWTRRLTHENLVEYLVEESYETLEEIESGRVDESLRRELGDVLFQVVLHARLAEERGSFDLDGVAEAITAKLVRRSPHVFTPEGRLAVDEHADLASIQRAWARIKAEEKAGEHGGAPPRYAAHAAADDARDDRAAEPDEPDEASEAAALAAVVDSLPSHLPALARAAKTVDRLARDGAVPADEPDGSSPLGAADEDALGELLFTVVHEARRRDQDPERALRRHLTSLAQGRVGPRMSHHQQ
ncbi:MazG nucleotide pyrophosphohydrolase domain-containing protein [Nesterenkonia sp. F]|uniref:MazG nucleotide pyrophosphohydrolase domain-containing protein n=1 Tax=Nesterenkonia sp. F TaxID=795955 RepID=UPI001ED96825|nr:MazG nucleotide pyrophosphohydrolase domain-containing protein [Nesterenkonia sp. F]